MTKPDIVRAWCEARVGCPYVYGGTGQPCTPEYRKARAAQYPQKAEKIKRNCPRLSGTAIACADCKWCDPETGVGKPAYDCAQLSRGAMEAVGIPMVSGANSQWSQTDWAERGKIADMPLDRVCLVFRDDGDKMGHVGVYTGDGYVTHAKGHDWGVVRERLADTKFTHAGIPVGLCDGKPALPILRQGDVGAYVMMLQTILCDLGPSIGVDGQFGPETANAVKAFQKGQGLTVDGVVGPKTWAALKTATGHEEEDPDVWDPDDPEIVTPPAVDMPSTGQPETGAGDINAPGKPDTVTITRADWNAIRAAAAVLWQAVKKYEEA